MSFIDKVLAPPIYFEEGRYLLKIVRTFVYFRVAVVEFEILQSRGEGRLKPGLLATWVVSGSEAGRHQAIDLVAAATGVASEKIAEQQVMDAFTHDPSPIAGRSVWLECTTTNTRTGKPFLLHTFSPASQKESECTPQWALSRVDELIAEGYEQISRKYRTLARLPYGKTGLEALAEVDPDLAVQYLRNAEEMAKSQYLRVYSRDKVELTTEAFNEFLQKTGRRPVEPR